ncbi:MAG: hypothetical protein JNK26_03135 [Candidatus Doudnabacteria bacterium]|nr:hypothetical protein [Candidatus Doudnabacteria bacterium]
MRRLLMIALFVIVIAIPVAAQGFPDAEEPFEPFKIKVGSFYLENLPDGFHYAREGWGQNTGRFVGRKPLAMLDCVSGLALLFHSPEGYSVYYMPYLGRRGVLLQTDGYITEAAGWDGIPPKIPQCLSNLLGWLGVAE